MVKSEYFENIRDGDRQFFFEMKEGHKFYCVKILIIHIGIFIEILYTLTTVKTSKFVVKSGCF